jgi:hypothetical protein
MIKNPCDCTDYNVRRGRLTIIRSIGWIFTFLAAEHQKSMRLQGLNPSRQEKRQRIASLPFD